MNTRIDKLWGQALDQSVPETWAALDSAQLSKLKAKFAELIVRECINVVDNMADPDDSDHYFWTIQSVSKQIKEHFGVEK